MCKVKEGLALLSPWLISKCFLSTLYQSCHDEEDDDGEEEVKSFEVRLYFCFAFLVMLDIIHSFQLTFMFLGSWLTAAYYASELHVRSWVGRYESPDS